MPIFNFIETFFFISLGISFILIVLLVYHFKQRITALEQKNDTMFEIINNIVKEITMIKTSTLSSPGMRNPFSFDFFNKFKTEEQDNTPQEINVVEDDEDEEEEDEDEEDEDEEDDDEEDDDEEDEEDNKEDSNDEEKVPFKIVVLDEPEGDNADDLNEVKTINISIDTEKSDDANLELFIQKTENSIKSESAKETYQKMSLSALKSLVISKELTTDSSKMKKHELIKMLESV